jgi:hypothetical protein
MRAIIHHIELKFRSNLDLCQCTTQKSPNFPLTQFLKSAATGMRFAVISDHSGINRVIHGEPMRLWSELPNLPESGSNRTVKLSVLKASVG